jgi:integrase
MDLAAMFAKIRKQREADRLEAMSTNDRYAQEAEQVNADRRARGLKRRVKPVRVAVPRPFGPSSATRVRATISSALADAVAQGEVTRNVAAQTRQRRGRKNRRPRVRVWEPDQLGAWLDALEAQAERLYPLVYVATFAGLRRGELCGLKWSVVDLVRGRITVDWQRTAAGYQVVENDPKTDESESTIDIDATTVAVLKAWRKVQLAERLKWGQGYHKGGYVFVKEDGQPYHPDYVTKRITRLMRKHGMPPASLHTLRHTAASLQIAAGVDIAIVSKRMRHSTIGLTNDTYGHLIGKAGQKAARAAVAQVPRRNTRQRGPSHPPRVQGSERETRVS